MKVDKFKLGHILVDKDLTTMELAERAGVSRVTISNVKNGKSVRYETAGKIAEALGVEVKDFRSYEK